MTATFNFPYSVTVGSVQGNVSVSVANVANNVSLEYEEIGDIQNSFHYTQNVLYGVSSSKTGREGVAVPEGSSHEYEDIKLAGVEVTKSDGGYQIEQCAAYGVHDISAV